jgi:hypothetical protein
VHQPRIKLGLLLLVTLIQPVFANTNKIFGLTEKVYIEAFDTHFEAKIDTGAESVSINAINVRIEKAQSKDEDDLVHFDLIRPDNSLKSLTLPLKKHIRIKRRATDYKDHEKDYARRPVLELDLCIGGQHRTVEANLADRRQFSKPVLIGSEPLVDFNALVDPSEEFLQDINLCNSSGEAIPEEKDPEE